MIEVLRFVLCALLMGMGLFFEICAVIGVFKFTHVLSRMHAAALGDTMGILMIMLGLVVACGLNVVSLKLILIVFLFWTASPVASHLIGRLEQVTNEHLDQEVKAWKR
ncbi:MAG: monovalent cation/H(+) antiporter subunit G [Christensenellales bacterium]|jgi:multicomponent Na+:H+ antiporter subunit G|nr:monovalent cation/H(+) antiporter subunit G [Christensenellales bacterium]